MTEGTQTTTPETDLQNPEAPADDKKEKKKIKQSVEIKDVGPCKKHIRVLIERPEIDTSFEEKYKDLVGKPWVPGFRPGRRPNRRVRKADYRTGRQRHFCRIIQRYHFEHELRV